MSKIIPTDPDFRKEKSLGKIEDITHFRNLQFYEIASLIDLCNMRGRFVPVESSQFVYVLLFEDNNDDDLAIGRFQFSAPPKISRFRIETPVGVDRVLFDPAIDDISIISEGKLNECEVSVKFLVKNVFVQKGFKRLGPWKPMDYKFAISFC